MFIRSDDAFILSFELRPSLEKKRPGLFVHFVGLGDFHFEKNIKLQE